MKNNRRKTVKFTSKLTVLSFEAELDRFGRPVSARGYSIVGESITCLACGRTSHNLNDVMHRYCANCKVFHGDPTPSLEAKR